MSVIVIKSETTEYRILVKAGDEELARQEAVKAAISAEAARLSALDAGESEQVATEKAAQTVEDATSALASKVDAESAATASEGFATDSGISATASEAAKVLSEAAKVIAIEEAEKSSTSAGQSAGSAAAAELAKNQILNKAEVNLTTAGNILRADGTLFKSISEVEFLRNVNAYQRAPDSKFFDNKQLIAWDNFNRPNVNPILQSDSGHTYSIWKGNTIGQIFDNNYFGNNSFIESTALITINATKNLGVEFSFLRNTSGAQISAFAIVKDLNNYIAFGRFAKSSSLGAGNLFTEIPSNLDYSLFAVINGVATLLGSISQQTMYSGSGNADSFFGSRLNFVIKYGNRGRNDNSSLVVQSLDNPALRIDVNVTNLNTTFVNPSDYNRIAIIANLSQIMSYKVANLNL